MVKKSKGGSQKKDQYTVVLEDLRSQFKVFGEALMGVDDKVNGLKKDVAEIKQTQDSHTEIIGQLMVDMTGVKQDVSVIKQDVKEIKGALKTKVDAKEVLRLVKANIV